MNRTKQEIPRQISKYVRIPVVDVFLLADLQVSVEARSLVILAYDFCRSRNHPRNLHVARAMRERGLGTLLCDLLTDDEHFGEDLARKAEILADRLLDVTKWANKNPETKDLKIGYFGVGTAGGAVLIGASKSRNKVGAVVCRSGRVDLAAKAIPMVSCPTLLMVGEEDSAGVQMNEEAYQQLTCEKDLEIIPGATQLFAEPGKLQEMAEMSAKWFLRHIGGPPGIS